MKMLQNNSKYLFWSKKQFSKLLAVLVVVSIFSGVLNVNETVAYYSDTESSVGNTLTAGTLTLGMDSTTAFNSDLLYPTDSTSTSINISNTGSLGSQYIAKTTLSGANVSACDYVTMTATSPTSTYTGLIKDFTSTATSTTNTAWNFGFTVAPSTPPSVWGKTCFFKWTYTAWQGDLPNSSTGFSSVKEKLGSIRIGKAVVLNEVLPNPTGLDDAPMPGGEWVELYNNSNVSFDLNGWYIYDSTDVGEVPVDNAHTGSGTTIASHGFLVVYRNGDGDFILNNDADSIRLFTNRISLGGVLVDSYSWTTEKPEGFSYARIPDGVGAWVDPIPTPGTSNKVEEVVVNALPDATTGGGGAEVIAPPDVQNPPTDEVVPDDTLPPAIPEQIDADESISAPPEATPPTVDPSSSQEDEAIPETEPVAPIVEPTATEETIAEPDSPVVEPVSVVEPVVVPEPEPAVVVETPAVAEAPVTP
ncbi:MAG: TasA family protein [Candidatus Pacebacteria bacterium]|nr:TasA family protein [Candidatus Paceibacterota bacterium]